MTCLNKTKQKTIGTNRHQTICTIIETTTCLALIYMLDPNDSSRCRDVGEGWLELDDWRRRIGIGFFKAGAKSLSTCSKDAVTCTMKMLGRGSKLINDGKFQMPDVLKYKPWRSLNKHVNAKLLSISKLNSWLTAFIRKMLVYVD